MNYKYSKKKTEKEKLIASCDRYWRMIVNPYNICALPSCKSGYKVQAHHIIKKGIYPHVGWWLIENGIPLCWKHHYNGIHSSYFPAQAETQLLINQYLLTKEISYDSLYLKCKKTKQKIDVSYLRLVKLSFVTEFSKLKKQTKKNKGTLIK